MTASIRRRLRELLAGERTEAAAVEAGRLLAELEGGEKKPPAPRRAVVDEAAAARAAEDLKWRRTLARIGRGGGSGSAVIYRPGGRESERPSVRENEQKTYLRRSSHWR